MRRGTISVSFNPDVLMPNQMKETRLRERHIPVFEAIDLRGKRAVYGFDSSILYPSEGEEKIARIMMPDGTLGQSYFITSDRFGLYAMYPETVKSYA